MTPTGKNSLDLLRLVAAAFVLYSHQYALLGLAEPSFFGWNSFGGAGVTIFFFLSGMLVWSSWDRDSNIRRFFQRRSLRIFPALWVVVFLSIFLLGPILTVFPWHVFFSTSDTWRYLTTALLLPRNVLPGVFDTNPYPHVINGSLWTLPVEFLCYVTVAAVGIVGRGGKVFVLGLTVLVAVLLATYMPLLTGVRFAPHFEMVAMFWWGALYGYSRSYPWKDFPYKWFEIAGLIAAALIFALLGPRSMERTSILLFAMASVFLAQRTDIGARLTDRLGDLSYGIYIYAFPVQQAVVIWLGSTGRSFTELFCLSLTLTLLFAYASWHIVERPALQYKPKIKLPP